MNREWERDVDRQLRELYDRTADLPFRTKPGGGGGGSGTSWAPYERSSEEALIATTTTDNGDPLPHSALAVITNGDLAGSWWGRNQGNTGWRCLTVWREP